ncbi:MAG: sialate O-acetylesterase [Ferruginibacter sp.]
MKVFNKIFKSGFVIVPMILFFINHVFANVKLPALFSDNMVLQQKSKVNIWGWADPGEQIWIVGSWSRKNVKTIAGADGKWSTHLMTGDAGGPFTITVNGNNKVELKDILLGEVWVCSGQSNMVFSLKGADNAKEEIAKADYPDIRYFDVKRQYAQKKFDDAPGSVWEKTSPKMAGGISAVAYYFARSIKEKLNVPIGIIYSAWGGTPAEAWTPNDVITSDTTLSKYIDRWNYIQKNVGKDSVVYHKALDEWEKNKGEGTKTKKPEEPQTLYYYNRPWREPSVLFNGMIDPVIPFTIKGFLWYQGESNVGYANEYGQLLEGMINSWRKRWGNQDLPFHIVQIAAFGYSDMNAGATVRDQQYKVSKDLKNTGLAVTADLGNMKDIHYTHKKEVGERLALIALAKNYGFKNEIYAGPECKKAIVENGHLELTFDQSLFTKNGTEVAGFEIGYKKSDADSLRFEKITASIQDKKIIIPVDKNKMPLSVRYAWILVGEANLQNGVGLPAFPFQLRVKN